MSALSTRVPAVAGMFYPDGAHHLASTVREMLADAPERDLAVKALIVPHAGYVYSGPIAASAYAALGTRAAAISRVVLFGPAHRHWVPGMAASAVDAFSTPLGTVPLDRKAIAATLRLPQVELNDTAHAEEHSLEVQLPFLQTVLDDFSIVPFVVGGARSSEVAEVMELLWGGPETLIVVSSDLSHYLPYAEACAEDRTTVDSVLRRQLLAHHEQACGATPINGLIEVARHRNLRATLLDLRNSGDTAGDKSRVVGYGAIAFAEPGHE